MEIISKFKFILILTFCSQPIFGFQQNSFSLEGIQDNIYQAFVEAIVTDDPGTLLTIGENLKILEQERDLDIIKYWRTYHAYYAAIYYVGIDDSDKAEDLVDDHIDLMESIKNPSADDIAMMSMIRSFSIQFKAMFRAPFISGKVGRDLEKALKIEPDNPRVLYVKASSDFYTPEQYGGGKQVEELLTKVLESNEPDFINPVMPSWGKREAYELLLQWYIRKEEKEKAEALVEAAIADFPNNYRIIEMGEYIAGM
jgi:hypothetical protein